MQRGCRDILVIDMGRFASVAPCRDAVLGPFLGHISATMTPIGTTTFGRWL